MLLGELLLPIESLEPDLFITAWVECYRCKCHYLLWEQGIKHGDISTANLMWDPESQRGILNDFDLATTPNRAGPSGTERTGTVPFMALALLSEEYLEGQNVREYHHDLESFIWVLVWVALLDNQGQQLFLQTWNTSNVELSKSTKMALLYAVKFPKYKTYKGDKKGGNRWTLAVSLLRYLISLQDKTMGEDCVNILPKVIFMEFEKEVELAWELENISFAPMLNRL
ncbi:hypothetical protein BDZ94DRAFT_1173311 [Collybia nuda]|uniref:Fungal-type protein kinase domain-containing protein n=1 Tax=Collybia nuda TaxID=64659 RepID=A0A9P5XXK0_9AGAR|nr:hypothetical protein BDZ94DRAFT_1173311 [Collybia nuda]